MSGATDERWVEFRQRFIDFSGELLRIHMIARAATTVLSNFPAGLSSQDMERLNSGVATGFRALLGDLQAHGRDDGQAQLWTMPDVTELSGLDHDPGARNSLAAALLEPAMRLLLLVGVGGHPEGLEFEGSINAQQLVMSIALTDALLNDAVRTICEKTPALAAGLEQERSTKEAAEERAYREGRGRGLLDRVDRLNDAYGLSVELSAKAENALSHGEQLRHMYMHNGGRVSARLKERIQMDLPLVGTKLAISRSVACQVTYAAEELGGEVFSELGRVHFGLSPGEFDGGSFQTRTAQRVFGSEGLHLDGDQLGDAGLGNDVHE